MSRKLALPPLVVAIGLATFGWLYLLRPVHAPGPRVGDSLGLDVLAKADAMPLLWFAAVWLLAALLVAAVARWARVERLTGALMLALGTFAVVYLTTGTSIAIALQIPARAGLHVAGRHGAVYLPAAIVGLVVAAAAGSRRETSRASLAIAALVAACGALDLIHGILPGEARGLWRNLTPEAVGPLARATGLFAGLAFLLSARGLARQRRRAWQVAVAVAALSTTLHILHGFARGAMLSALVLILLVARRHEFVRPGDVQSRFLAARRAVVAVAGIAIFGFVTLWVNQAAADQPFTGAFATREIVRGLFGLNVRGSKHLAGPFGEWFPLTLLLLGLGSTAWVLAAWVAPWRHRVRQRAEERVHAQELVRAWGADTLAPFALRRDKSYFFSRDERAFLAYRVLGGVVIVSGDPIGPDDALPELVSDFVAHAHRCDWRVAILGASERWLSLYRVHGLQALYHGDEAVVETASFSLDGRRVRKVRQSAHRLERAGFTTRFARPGELDARERAALERISDEWRAGRPNRGFAMAIDALFNLDDEDAVFAIGYDETGEPQGFLHLAVVRAAGALSLSSMPRLRESTPNGFNEWLIVETIAWARSAGYVEVSLNFSPFAALLAPETKLSTVQELQRQGLLLLKGHFQLDNLLAFNRKFFPRWERRFLVYEHRLDLPRVGIAALAAEAYLPFQTARQ